MKKTIICAAALAALVSCAWAKKKPDLYDDKKMHPTDRSGLEKFLGTNRYDICGDCAMFIRPVVGKIKAKRGEFIYRRGTDVAGFRIQYDTSAYTVEMAEEPRKICCDAIDKYFADFENKRLNRKASAAKTRVVYGHAPGYEEFGIAKSAMNYKAKPELYFGYDFVDGNPYFVIHVPKAKNLTLEGKSSDIPNLETIVQNYYFTRAQAQKLKEFICEENISLFHAAEEEKLKDLRVDSVMDEYVENDGEAPSNKKAKKAKKDKKNKAEENSENDDYAENQEVTPIKKKDQEPVGDAY